MRHYACAAAIGVLAAGVVAPISQSHAASADPTGYWLKPDAERESKIQVFKCGSGKTQLCAKITWLKEPNDSNGRPLHDIRNEDPSLRGRPIVGLPIFSGLTPSAPSTWTGKIYNPEDGHTYAATLTVLSRKQIVLRGCKAWLLCGEKQWLRTTAPEEATPPAPAEGAEQIEASVTPQTPPAGPSTAASMTAAEPPAMRAEAKTAKAPIEAAAVQGEIVERASTEAAVREPAAPVAEEIASPTEPPAEIDARSGYRFLTVATDPDATARLSGEDVSSMFLMTRPIAAKAAVPATVQPAAKTAATHSAEPASLPAAKPKAEPKPVATAAAKPALKTEASAKPAEQGTAALQDGDAVQADADSADAAPATSTEAALVEPLPLTRKERRMMRKQQRDLERGQEPVLPWLR